MKKKIIIFGATGNTGSYLLEYALNFFNKEEYEIIASGRRETTFFPKGEYHIILWTLRRKKILISFQWKIYMQLCYFLLKYLLIWILIAP